MADKGSKDKGKKEQQKKAKLNPKEKRKLKREKKNKSIISSIQLPEGTIHTVANGGITSRRTQPGIVGRRLTWNQPGSMPKRLLINGVRKEENCGLYRTLVLL